MVMNNLKGKVAVVTGGSGGIGSAVVKKLVENGASVLFTYFHGEDRAHTLMADLNNCPQVKAISADISCLSDIKNIFEVADNEFGGVDILVNNAAQISTNMIEDITETNYNDVMDINVKGSLFCIQQAIKCLRNNGRIINISSINTVLPEPGAALYSASKAALEQFSCIASKEVASRGITVNCISPGPVNTDLLVKHNPQEVLEQIAEMTPLGRVGEPEDIADIVAFLASSDARWVTGQNIRASGGLI
ncbi:SDR family oxidoreductase [Chryseobacterium nematophagum]|uniref:SDR family oxidoreductase n=2 Tax=Chryseobacterium nematophagum TaxID=2305228 RepID=A0A3M7L989_9FLAO|nr:SDR family oxidoreductase [Chryseobacterium nematophagum]